MNRIEINKMTKTNIYGYDKAQYESIVVKLITWAESENYRDLVTKDELIARLGISEREKFFLGKIIVNDVCDCRKQAMVYGKKRYCYHFPSREFLMDALQQAKIKYSTSVSEIQSVPDTQEVEVPVSGTVLHEGTFKFIKKNRIVGKCPDCGTIILKA